ncbi:MAG: hypothetical protein MRY78_10525 [Saprospiraceae bacterium]|nr:hypothetical protein [Saprospiraceae bacterium]
MNISDVNNDGIGMDGMDPVAYKAGEPLKGTSEFRSTVDKVTYHFVNKENLTLFEEDPAAYIPVAGSYLSHGVRGKLNDLDDDKKYVGNKTFHKNRQLEDSTEKGKSGVPNDMKEDGDVEMQNLSDSNS